MSSYQPRDPEFEQRVRESFSRQGLMQSIGAGITRVAPGEVDIQLSLRSDLTQQNGFLHTGVVTAIIDSACRYAALSLSPAGSAVLTVEYKVNFVAPAKGDSIVARGKVVRPGGTVTVCSGEAFAVEEGKESLIATMLTTVLLLPDSPDLAG